MPDISTPSVNKEEQESFHLRPHTKRVAQTYCLFLCQQEAAGILQFFQPLVITDADMLALKTHHQQFL